MIGGKVLSESPNVPRAIFYNYTRQNGLWPREVAALDPDKELEKLQEYCPIRHVTKDYPPTLFLHGDRDTDVPFEESVRMAAALKQVGVEHQLIRMRKYDHLFDVFPTVTAKIATDWRPPGRHEKPGSTMTAPATIPNRTCRIARSTRHEVPDAPTRRRRLGRTRPGSDRRWYPASRFMLGVASAQDSRCRLMGVPSGSHYAAAVTHMPAEDEEEAWHDPAFLDTLAFHATTVTMVEGRRQVLNLKLASPR